MASDDPYAAIRRLQFYQANPGRAEGSYYDELSGGNMWSPEVAADWRLGSGADDAGAYDAFRSSGFESKYGTPRMNADGTMSITLQQPGGHKYDTMEAVYTRGPDGWTLSNDPRANLSRQVSSSQNYRDTAEGFWPLLAVAGAGYAGGAYGGGGAGGIGSAEAAGALGGAGEAGAAGGAAAGGAAGGGAAGAAGGSGMSWFDWAQLGSSALQAYQAGRAQDAQTGAARDATALQGRMFDQLREDQAPYRGAGYAALGDLMGMRGGPSMTAADVMSEPGYEFGRLQGMRGVEGSAAARGMALSGAALKNAARFNSDYASTRFGDAWNRRQADFGNRWGRLSALAGIGQTATQQTGNAGMQFGAMGGNNMIGAGNAAAAGAITRGNAYGNMINQGLSMYGRQQRPAGGYQGQPGWSNDPGSDPYYMGG